MSDIAQILVLLLELYGALGLMLIGFGYMFSGKSGGRRAAQFYFGRSLRWTWAYVRRVLRAVLIYAWGAFIFWISRPIGHWLWRGARWFVTRQRGWLRP